MTTSEAGLRAIEAEEGLFLYVYNDNPGGQGTPTIGYGHTNLSGTAPRVVPGLRITKEQAHEILRADLKAVYEPALRRQVKVPLNQNQWDALISFIFNLGEGNFAKSRLKVVLNQGNYQEIPGLLMAYRYAYGKVMPGLVTRRHREGIRFMAPVAKSVTPTVVPVINPTPSAAPMPRHDALDLPPPTPPSKTDKVIEKAATAVPVVTAAASAFTDWKIAAVFATVGVLVLIGLFVVNRKEA